MPEVLVGPNDCQGVKAEKIEGLCKLHHTTNEDFIPPIKWRVKGSRGEEVLVPASFNRPRKVDSAEKDTSWELTDKISVGKKWEVFECYVEKTSLSCSEKFAPKSLLCGCLYLLMFCFFLFFLKKTIFSTTDNKPLFTTNTKPYSSLIIKPQLTSYLPLSPTTINNLTYPTEPNQQQNQTTNSKSTHSRTKAFSPQGHTTKVMRS